MDRAEKIEAEAHAEGRLVIEVRDADGNLTERSFGASMTERLAQHRAGKCPATGSWCHQALADRIGEDAAMAMMYERCFGSPMPTAKH